MEAEKKAVLEAALFVTDEPLDTDDIADILNLGSKGYVQMVVDELQEDLDEEHRGLEIIETGDGYRMQVKRDHIDQVRDLAPHQDLSDAALRTLSIIAYNAPVKQSKIIDIRGNRAYSQISDLEERGLLSSSKDGRTKVLDVTEDFLDYFGIDDIDEFRDGLDAEPAAEMLLDDEETEDAEQEDGQAEIEEPDTDEDPAESVDTGTERDTADDGAESDGDLLTTDGQLQ